MAVGDINRGTTGVVLPAQVSTEIWSTLQEQSAVMAVSRQISLPHYITQHFFIVIER